MGLFVPVRVFQTLEREYEETRVPLNGDAAKRAAFAQRTGGGAQPGESRRAGDEDSRAIRCAERGHGSRDRGGRVDAGDYREGRRSRFCPHAGTLRSRAKADARETKIRVQYDAPSEDTVRATVVVEWTREIPVKARGGS